MSKKNHFQGGHTLLRTTAKSPGGPRPSLKGEPLEDIGAPGAEKIANRNLGSLSFELIFSGYVANCQLMEASGEPWNPPPKRVLKRLEGMVAVEKAVRAHTIFCEHSRRLA